MVGPPIDEWVRNRAKVRLDLDQRLVEFACHFASCIGGPLAKRPIREGYIKAVNEDQMRDLLAILEEGVKRVHPSAEETSNARGLPRTAIPCLGIHGDALGREQELLVPAAKYILNLWYGREESRRDLPR